MMKSETISERAERIQVMCVAERYRSLGYDVVREPTLDFLPGFKPDLVVSKNGEHRVIEVKSRSSLMVDEELPHFVGAIHSQPGWTFDLHMVSEPEIIESPNSAKSLDVEDITTRLIDAQTLLESGQTDVAFLLAWAACEAAIRKLTSVYGFADDGITTATHLLDMATYHGVISRDDYFRFVDAATFRNAFVHGYKVDDFDPEMVGAIVASARNVVDAIGRGPISDGEDDVPDFWPTAEENGESRTSLI